MCSSGETVRGRHPARRPGIPLDKVGSDLLSYEEVDLSHFFSFQKKKPKRVCTPSRCVVQVPVIGTVRLFVYPPPPLPPFDIVVSFVRSVLLRYQSICYQKKSIYGTYLLFAYFLPSTS